MDIIDQLKSSGYDFIDLKEDFIEIMVDRGVCPNSLSRLLKERCNDRCTTCWTEAIKNMSMVLKVEKERETNRRR